MTDGRLPVIAHVGTTAMRDAIALAELSAKLGFAAISAVAPYYYGFSRADVRAHYVALADATALPLVVYNFPNATAGFTLSELIGLLTQPGIAGIKHTSMDLFMLERLLAGARGKIYNGFDEVCLAGLSMGAHGAIGTTYNFMGDVFVALVAHVERGELAEARDLQRMANGIIAKLIQHGVLPAAKVALDEMAVPIGATRLPFRRLSTEAEADVRSVIRSLHHWRELNG